jgi:hypothetical protein
MRGLVRVSREASLLALHQMQERPGTDRTPADAWCRRVLDLRDARNGEHAGVRDPAAETLAVDEARKHEPVAGRRLLRQARAGVIRSRDGLLPVAAACVCWPSPEALAYTCRGSGGRGRNRSLP